MIIKLLFLCLLRWITSNIVHTYKQNAEYCNTLLQKAKNTQIESVRHAYCVEVVEADHAAVLKTLNKYHIQFLASNSTYATFEEVLNYSCKVPSTIETLLQWTAGLIPLTTAVILLNLANTGREYLKKMKNRKKIAQANMNSEPESKDDTVEKNKQTKPQRIEKPPIYPTPSPNSRRDTQYIRKRKKPKEEKPVLSACTEKLVNSISPTLRKRIMNEP
jgi:hypothetical protein